MLGGIPPRSLALFSLALILASIAVLPDRAAAASGWQIVLDRPTPNFGPVDFASDNEGWMPAGAGLLHTTDGGATWTENAKLTVNDVDFFDQQHGWAVGPEAAIFHTTNGGETWEQQESGLYASMYFTDIEAISTSEAWAVALENTSDVPTFPDSAILHTTDRGENWIRVETSVPGAFDEVEFAGSTGWLLGAVCLPDCVILDVNEGMLRTTDSGTSWALVENAPPGAFQMEFADESHGWITSTRCEGAGCSLGNNTYEIHRTTDGGLTWSGVDVTALGGLPSVSFSDPMHGWGVSVECDEPFALVCEQHTIDTDDGGITWRLAATMPVPPAHRGSLTVQYNALYLSGSGIRSTDGGVTWQDMSTPAIALDAFDFIDRQDGFAFDGSHAMATHDAGRTWERRGTVEANDRLEAMQFFDESHGAAVFTGCNPDCSINLHQTSDGGRSWPNVTTVPGNGAEFKALDVGNDGAGVAAAYRGFAITTDSGQTWRSLEVPPAEGYVLNGAAILDSTHLWVDSFPEVDGPSVLVFSSDGGATWQEIYRGLALGDIQFFDAQHGWARSVDRYYRTSDGGHTWTEITPPEANRIYEVAFVDPLNGWASLTINCNDLCEYGLVHTTDGGTTWTEQPFDAPDAAVAHDLEFVDAQTGWFTTSPGQVFGLGGNSPDRTVLYHTTDGGGGPIGEPPLDLPDVGTGPARTTTPVLPLILAATGLTALTASFAVRRSASRI